MTVSNMEEDNGVFFCCSERALQDQKAQTSQALWSAAEALYDSLKHGAGDVTPLKDNIQAIVNASG